MDKWRTRRAEQVRKCKLDVPPGLAVIYGDMFRAVGIKVYYSEVDNDDTIAAYAECNQAHVLSGDKDYYRYREATFPIYSDYEIKNGYLELIEGTPIRHPKPRKLLDPLPPTFQKN